MSYFHWSHCPLQIEQHNANVIMKTGNGFPILFKAYNISLFQLLFLCDTDKGSFGIGQ